MLMWLMSEAKGEQRSLKSLARRLLGVNFAAIHTTSLVSHTGLFINLLIAILCSRLRMYCTICFPTRNMSNPFAATLRLWWQRRAGPRLGWIKCTSSIASYGKPSVSPAQLLVRWIALTRSQLLMHYSLFPVSLNRVALRPFTFSNGITVPAGTHIAVPSVAIHTDGEIYPNPKKFDGLRFAELRERNGVAVAGQQATSTSSEYFAFGYGRHAWCVFFCLDTS